MNGLFTTIEDLIGKQTLEWKTVSLLDFQSLAEHFENLKKKGKQDTK